MILKHVLILLLISYVLGFFLDLFNISFIYLMGSNTNALLMRIILIGAIVPVLYSLLRFKLIESSRNLLIIPVFYILLSTIIMMVFKPLLLNSILEAERNIVGIIFMSISVLGTNPVSALATYLCLPFSGNCPWANEYLLLVLIAGLFLFIISFWGGLMLNKKFRKTETKTPKAEKS